MHADRLSSEAV